MKRREFISKMTLGAIAFAVGGNALLSPSKRKLNLKPFVHTRHGGLYQDLKGESIEEGSIEHHVFLGESNDRYGPDRMEMIKINKECFFFKVEKGKLTVLDENKKMIDSIQVKQNQNISVEGSDWVYQIV